MDTYQKCCTALILGQLYKPASSHYATAVTVECDRCQKSNLTECWGYGDDFDICLECVAAVKKEVAKKYAATKKPVVVSDDFNDDDEKLSFMMQRQFRPKPPAVLATEPRNYNKIALKMRARFYNRSSDDKR